MGEIYSAQLTIVVCAGEHPIYGLPGVRLSARTYASCPVIYEPLHHNYLIALPQAGTYDINNSRWVSRAWTFQEGYLSKRRLFFTDRQVIFLCNEGISWNSADGRPGLMYELPLGPIANMLPHGDSSTKNSGLNQASSYLKEYCARSLSHDCDALSTISGALGTLSSREKDPAYHVSGYPLAVVEHDVFNYDSTYLFNYEPNVHIALFWYHSNKCRRRQSFPSWSPLGWEGPIDWLKSWFFRSCRAEQGSIVLCSEYGPIDLQRLTTKKHVDTALGKTREIQRLEITADTIELRFALRVPTPGETGDRDPTRIKLVTGEYSEVMILPYLDKDILEALGQKEILGLIIPPEGSSFGKVNLAWPYPSVLLIEQQGDHFERVGIFQVPKHGTQSLNLVRGESATDVGYARTTEYGLPWYKTLKKQRIILQ
jgi:hypothetical protein